MIRNRDLRKLRDQKQRMRDDAARPADWPPYDPSRMTDDEARRLEANGAKAWAGVDAQALRDVK